MARNLRGDEGSFTYTAGGDTLSLTSIDIDAWEAVIDRQLAPPVRPFGWAMEKNTVGGLRMRGRVHIVVQDGTTPPIPQGSNSSTGTIVLGVKGSTQKYTVKGNLYSLQTGANSTRNDQIDGWYEFVGSADSNTDTITAA